MDERDPFALPAGPSAPVGPTINRRLVIWDEAGNPVATTQPIITKAQINDLYFAAAAQPYIVDDPFDPDFGKYDGMTCAEVMVRKQILNAAKSGAAEIVMDRLLGRPKQTSESVRVTLTYEEKLRQIEQEERAKIGRDVERNAVPAEIVQ